MTEDQKKSNSGAGKFFLGAALGAIAGAIAGKIFSAKMTASDDEDNNCGCDGECKDEDCTCSDDKPAIEVEAKVGIKKAEKPVEKKEEKQETKKEEPKKAEPKKAESKKDAE